MFDSCMCSVSISCPVETSRRMWISKSEEQRRTLTARNSAGFQLFENYRHLPRRASDSVVPRLVSAADQLRRSTSDPTIVGHRKNYEKFMADQKKNDEQREARPRQTQSLARNAGRTFTEFIMNDLLSTPRESSMIHTASQTDLTVLEPVDREETLMERLFLGKKSAFNSANLQLQPSRIPGEMLLTYETAKKKCFFATEELLYASNMIKIDRRGYKRHVRMLCLTTERVYIITKKDPYPKEAVFLKDILSISCSPLRDGFVCLHTRETDNDRGDWIFIVDYPCEFLTHLFMALKRNDNADQFLKIESRCAHIRRNLATLNDECYIEVQPAEAFRIACKGFDTLVIFTP